MDDQTHRTLDDFPVTGRWPVENPNVLQLFSFPTPNGVKASAMLEETGLSYEAHRVTVSDKDVKSAEFLSLNPNNKIPAIIDPDGPDGKPLALFESGAILIYLADKTGKMVPSDPARRYETIQWLMWQMGGVGPMFGQIGYFHKFAGKDIEDKRPLNRYLDEARRLLGVLEGRLEGREWIMGDDYTIADIATWPWVRSVDQFYEAGDLVGLPDMPNVQRWLAAAQARPASQAALNIPSREG